jgi:hypothetical protein
MELSCEMSILYIQEHLNLQETPLQETEISQALPWLTLDLSYIILLPSDNLILESGTDVAIEMVVSLRRRMQKMRSGL